MKSKSILFICSVSNFQQYTRRATIEAIGKRDTGSSVLCLKTFWKKGNDSLKSDFINISYFYYFFPRIILTKIPFLNFFNFHLNSLFVNRNITEFEIVCFTFPTQSHLLPFFKNKKKIFILSDPYHLMKQTYSTEKILIDSADLIFATAKGLSKSYIPKYFGEIRGKVIYWPNCVDLNIWNLVKVNTGEQTLENKNNREEIVIGFAGNFMKVTDIKLLKGITTKFSKVKFVLAGQIENDLESSDYIALEEIFALPNVDYKGLIPYNLLQKEIAAWNIGIMIDKINEISSYHHHNKFYQYLALGLPVVYQSNHEDYVHPHNIAFPSADLKTFIQNLEYVISQISLNFDYSKVTTEYVKNHTNDDRALVFLEEVSQLAANN